MSASRQNKRAVTLAVLVATFLASLDVTIVSTAMPTIVGVLGGLPLLPWVFSIYLLTSSVTTPVYGRLADIFGRKRTFVFGAGLFLIGSMLCGLAQSMPQLVLYRAVQGLGAGAVLPVTLTIVGDLYTLQERARMQGVFSAVWGVSAVVGPALGGLIVDTIGWRWVFYLNLPAGLASIALVWIFLHDPAGTRARRIDWAGSALLAASVTLFLLVLLQGGQAWPWASPQTFALLALAAATFAAFIRQERRFPEPMLPLDLFADRVISVSTLANVLIGAMLTGTSSFLPLFVQGVQGGSASQAGTVITWMSLGWPIGSTLGGRLIQRIGYRATGLLGIGCNSLAAAGLFLLRPDSPRWTLGLLLGVLGLGFGFGATAFLISVQNAVDWSRRGIATATVTFMRTVGATVGVAVMGTVLNAGIAARLPDDSPAVTQAQAVLRTLAPAGGAGVRTAPAGEGAGPPGGSPALRAVNALVDPAAVTALQAQAPAAVAALRNALAGALVGVFVVIAGASAIGLLVAARMPAERARDAPDTPDPAHP